jgi:hypothetical protein
MPQIVPYDQITTKVIYSFNIDNIDLVLFNSAKIRVSLLSVEGYTLDVKYVTMAGEDYTNWGNDDQYVINFVATTLGFTIINEISGSTTQSI